MPLESGMARAFHAYGSVSWMRVACAGHLLLGTGNPLLKFDLAQIFPHTQFIAQFSKLNFCGPRGKGKRDDYKSKLTERNSKVS